MDHLLGLTGKDKITGFKGVVVGYAVYISGCNQVLVVPRTGPGGEFREGQWFDAQRIEVDDHANRIELDNGPTPGPDKPAPKR